MIDKKLADETGRQACLSRLAVLGAKDDGGFSHITRVVRTALDMPMAAVTLIGADTQWIRSGQGLDLDRTSRSSSFCTVTIEERGTLVVEDALHHAPFSTNEYVLGAPHIRSYVGVPLVTMDGYQVGSLCAMGYEPRTFGAGQVELMEQLARCVENELELKMKASLDGLTQLLSRTAFIDIVAATRAELDPSRPVSLAILDLDHFKSINDTYGHPAGDEVLKATARQLAQSVGAGVPVGRLGGEEFGVLLPRCTVSEAVERLELFRSGLETMRVVDGFDRRITVSAGVTDIRPGSDGSDVSPAFKRADIALYQAKARGRNRIEMWDGSSDAVPVEALVLPNVRHVRAGDSRFDTRGRPEEIAATLVNRFGRPMKVRRRDMRARKRSVA